MRLQHCGMAGWSACAGKNFRSILLPRMHLVQNDIWCDRVYIPARHRTRFFLCVLTYTRYQCISHFLRMIQDFLTKLNGKWRHNQRPYVSRPNEVYILGHILAKWKLHYSVLYLYSDSKWNWLINGHFTTISGHFFANCMFIFHKTEVQTMILRC